MPRKGGRWIDRQIHHFRNKNLHDWGVHPAAIELGWIRTWLKHVPNETPDLDVKAAYALTRLYHLEAYSSEQPVVIRACARTACQHGWKSVCTLVQVPTDRQAWKSYEFARRDMISEYLEDIFDDQLDYASANIDEPEAYRLAYESGIARFEKHSFADLLQEAAEYLEDIHTSGALNMRSNHEYEERVLHFLTENGNTVVIPQPEFFYENTKRTSYSPDFVAIRTSNSGTQQAFIVEASVQGWPANILYKIRKSNIERVRKHLLENHFINSDGVEINFLVFIKSDVIKKFDENLIKSSHESNELSSSVYVWPIEAVMMHWLWKPSVRQPDFDFKDSKNWKFYLENSKCLAWRNLDEHPKTGDDSHAK